MENSATARSFVETKSASRYLQQLCKHWSHKAETEFDPAKGFIQFESGNRLEMAASDAGLEMTIRSGDAEHLGMFKEVVDKHLLRFAFREELTINWS